MRLGLDGVQSGHAAAAYHSRPWLHRGQGILRHEEVVNLLLGKQSEQTHE